MSTAPNGTGVEDPRGPVDRGGDPPPAQGAGASVAGSGEPPAVADAAAAAEVPVEVTEVSGFTGSLAQALEQSAVPKPELGNYNEWLAWRKRAGKRPTMPKDGVSTSSAKESELWRQTMKMCFGEDWRDQLDKKTEAVAAAEEEQAGRAASPAGTRKDPRESERDSTESGEDNFIGKFNTEFTERDAPSTVWSRCIQVRRARVRGQIGEAR